MTDTPTAASPSPPQRLVVFDCDLLSYLGDFIFQPGLSISWCKQPDVGLPKPDLVCFLDVSEEVAMKRADFGGERYELTDFQRKVILKEH